MEEYKWRFFSDFLKRDCNGRLDHYTNLMKALEERARRCYDSSIVMTPDDFGQMLLIDGCFILEILLKWDNRDFISLANVSSRMSYIRSDLLLLENQLPFFVLEKLLKLLMGDHIQSPCDSQKNIDVTDYLMRIIFGFLNEKNERNMTFPTSQIFEGEIIHMLHLLYKWSVPNLKEKFHTAPKLRLFPCFRGSRVKERRHPAIPNATSLALTGVTFKSTKPSSSFFDVVFDKGVMKLPTFKIDSEGMSRLANLMVFEQSLGLEDHKVASYVLLMDSLIDTGSDVDILKVCGVVQNTLESDWDAASFFNQLGEHRKVDLKNHYYAPLFDEVLDFYESKWNRNKASLGQKYFNSPWAAISLFAATALMILTGLQTIYTVAGYYSPN